MKNLLSLAIAIISLLGVNQSFAATVNYTWTNIGHLGLVGGSISPFATGKTTGFALNDSAVVVGTSQYNQNNHAFTYSQGVMTDLGNLGYDRNVIAMGVNNSGQIVGQSSVSGNISSYVTHAFSYYQGTMSDIGTLGGNTSYAFGVNDSGQIVGSSRIADGSTHAFSYSNNMMTDLGTLPGASYSNATSINNQGQIVGYSGSQAIIYDTGIMRGIGYLPGSSQSYALDINDLGYVVGASSLADGIRRAFLYSNGQMLNLGALSGDSEARAINNQNQVVGSTGGRAFIWTLESGMLDLNSLILPQSGILPELAEAVGINEYGQIVCISPYLPGINGSVILQNTYLLTPTNVVPLPSAMWLLGSGFIVVVVAKKARKAH